jgi:hypothetical protein
MEKIKRVTTQGQLNQTILQVGFPQSQPIHE